MLAQSPFDILAETYDADFTQTEIGKLQRTRVWKLLQPVLQSCDHPAKILEINCGTGEDALRLASLGHIVTATDASQAMIKKAKQKLSASERGKVEFIQCSFNQLEGQFSNEKFDLIFSNFGGINCICRNEIRQLSEQLSAITATNGKLFIVVMGNLCLWEFFYYSLKGKFRTAFRRRKRSVLFTVNGSSMPVFYYAPADLKRLFNAWFKSQRSYPVGLFIPPSYLEKQFLKKRKWLNRLRDWEENWGKLSLFSSFADHYCIILKKRKQK